MLSNQKLLDSIENILLDRDTYNYSQKDRVWDLFRLHKERTAENRMNGHGGQPQPNAELRNFLLNGPDATRLAGHISEKSLRTVSYTAQSAATDNLGGYICPEEFVRSLLLRMQGHDGIFDLATRVTTGGGQPCPLPIANDVGSASVVAESAETSDGVIAFSGIAFGQTPMWRSGLIVTPIELLQDSGLDFENAVLQPVLARRFARGMGTTFTATLLANSTAGKVATSQTAITADELWDLIDSVDSDYAQNGSLLMRRSTYVYLSKLKNTNANYYFPAQVVNGRPYLCGFPVHFSPAMGAMTASEKPISFGDHSRFYVRDAGGMRLLRFREQYIEKGGIGFEGFWRADGALGRVEASPDTDFPCKYLEMAEA